MKKTNLLRGVAFTVLMIASTSLLVNCKKDKTTEETPTTPTPTPCSNPVITISSPQGTVNSLNYALNANVSNINNSSLITLSINGANAPFSYNPSTGILLANLTLNGGTNIISIVANGCSVITSTFGIVFPNNTYYLTGKTFKLTQILTEYTGGSNTTTSGCSNDNTIVFNIDQTLNFDEGATKCDPSEPQTKSGTWSWSNSDTKLTINETNPASSTTYDVITNNGTILKISYEPLNDYKVTFTWTKQ